jgi:hypothetical protein
MAWIIIGKIMAWQHRRKNGSISMKAMKSSSVSENGGEKRRHQRRGMAKISASMAKIAA